MSPFDLAQSLGYGKNDILKFLSKTNPQISNALTKAVTMGYTTDQVFQFLSKSMAGGKVDAKFSKRVFGDPNAASMMRQAENVPQRQSASQIPMLGALAGAGVGFATGGPVGAAIGGMAGYKKLDDLTKAYEGHIQSGGSIPFGSFVSSLAQGAALAGIAASQVGPLKEAAQQYMQAAGGEPEEGQPPVTEEEAPPEDTILTPGGVLRKVPPPKEGVPFTERAMEGIDFKDLGSMTQNRLRILNKKLEGLEQKGVPYESRRVQKLLEKRDKFISGEGLTVAEQEIERFEKGYGPLEEPQRDALTDIFKSNIPEGIEVGEVQKSIKPLSDSLKSSNVLGAFFNNDTGKMRTVFKSGDIYEYDNITLDEMENITGGKARPLTEGSSEFGFWFPDKKKSIGAAFSKYIKKKAEDFPYRKLEKSEHRPKESQLRDAVRTFTVSGIFDPFKKIRKKGRQLKMGQALKEMEPALKESDDDFLGEMVAMLEEQLKLKRPPKMSRLQKEFRKEFL